jgi:co-chaperonin GroES (HSP10)
MSIKLLRNLVALRPIVEEKSASGIVYIQKTAPGAKKRGTVVSVGPGVYTAKGEFIATVVKVGDVVAYLGDGEVVEIDGEKLSVLPEELVIGVIG